MLLCYYSKLLCLFPGRLRECWGSSLYTACTISVGWSTSLVGHDTTKDAKTSRRELRGLDQEFIAACPLQEPALTRTCRSVLSLLYLKRFFIQSKIFRREQGGRQKAFYRCRVCLAVVDMRWPPARAFITRTASEVTGGWVPSLPRGAANVSLPGYGNSALRADTTRRVSE